MVCARPRVSVILPCLDASRTLTEAIESALGQSHCELEILAVDDGSTDDTPGLLDRIVARAPDRVRVFHQSRSGPYTARNLAAEHATGEYLAFLDADDLWHPMKLEMQVRCMRARPRAVLCHTGIRVLHADGSPWRTVIPDPAYRGACFERLLVENRIGTSSVVVRRRDFHAVGGFDERFPARGDWEMWTRLARRGEVVAIDAPLTSVRSHPDRMSLDTSRMRRHHLAIIRHNAAAYRGATPSLQRLIKAARLSAHLQYASDFLRAGRGGRALGESLLALRAGPTSARAWKTTAKAVLTLAHRLPPR